MFVQMLKHPIIDIDVEVRECLWWLSLPSNRHWFLIFDNVDRDYHNKDNSQAYSVKDSSFEIRLEFPSVHIRAFTSSTPFGNCIDEVGHMEALEGSQPATSQTEVVRGMHLDTFVSEENPFSINGKVCSSLLAAWRAENASSAPRCGGLVIPSA